MRIKKKSLLPVKVSHEAYFKGSRKIIFYFFNVIGRIELTKFYPPCLPVGLNSFKNWNVPWDQSGESSGRSLMPVVQA